MGPISMKSAAAIAGGTGLLFAQAATPASGLGSDELFKRITELGSFGLVAFGVYLAFTKWIPMFTDFLEKRDNKFTAELKEERDARERAGQQMSSDLRGMISAQTETIVRKLDEVKTAVKDSSP